MYVSTPLLPIMAILFVYNMGRSLDTIWSYYSEDTPEDTSILKPLVKGDLQSVIDVVVLYYFQHFYPPPRSPELIWQTSGWCTRALASLSPQQCMKSDMPSLRSRGGGGIQRKYSFLMNIVKLMGNNEIIRVSKQVSFSLKRLKSFLKYLTFSWCLGL